MKKQLSPECPAAAGWQQRTEIVTAGTNRTGLAISLAGFIAPSLPEDWEGLQDIHTARARTGASVPVLFSIWIAWYTEMPIL